MKSNIQFTRRLITMLIVLFFVMSATRALDTTQTWPKEIEKGDATIVLYQPQIESLTANTMEARAAISVTNEEYTTPLFGAMWFECNISTDRDDRTVHLDDLKVVASRFPDVEEENIKKLSAFLEKEIPSWDMEMSLDALLADLEMSDSDLGNSAELNNAPPEIIFTTTPTVLVMVDGDPIFQEIEDTNYERVVNSPFFIVRDTRKNTYYINGGMNWYESDNANDWNHTAKVPKKLEQIAEKALDTGEDGYAGEEAMQDAEGEEAVVPELILRTSPAELLQSQGKPEFSPIEGTSILYMSNTADDILMNIETQEYFILVAGRWYKSTSLESGPWTFVEPGEEPSVFADIPSDSDVASVRSSVAGTREAKEAVLENQIPQTAEVDRKEAKLEVEYDGKPRFEAVGETGMKYAVNTEKSVLLIDGRYYCCDDAIWFESESASGPWIVSTAVPDQIQEIPPESPVYNVKYVYIYDSTPDIVYVGYTPGYVHSYIYHGCVYYGTGYYYNPWYGVHYYPRPLTYGFNVHWNPYTGWGFSYSVSWGWMTVGWGAPHYGWWGPAGYRYGHHYGYHHGYNRGYRAGYYAGRHDAYHHGSRPVPYGGRQQAHNNVYRNRSQGVSRTGNTYIDPRTGNSRPPSRETRPTAKPSDRSNNVYTDRDGNVYRRDGDQWSRVDNSRPSTRESRPSTGQPSTRESRPSTGQPSTRESRPSTGQPSTRESRPSTGQPSTRESRPSTGQPSTREARPSTGQSGNREARPSTGQSSNRQARPSTGQPSSRQGSPSTRQGSPSSRQGNSSSRQLEQDYQSRNRGTQRSQQYQQNRGQYQYSRPSGSYGRSQSGSRPSGSRPSPSRGASPRRR